MALFTVPTLSQRISLLRSRLLSKNKNISTLPGSVAGDLFVLPQAESDVQQIALAYYTSISQSVTDLLDLKTQPVLRALIASALNITDDALLVDIASALERIGANFSVPRLQPKKATGSVTFVRTDAPPSDVVIPLGKTVKASDGSQFVTTSDVVMYASVAASYYYSDDNIAGYVLEVPVEAVDEGTAGNAPALTVTSVVTPVNGFPMVTNLNVISGGLDLETDEAYGARILLRWQALGRTTKAGVKYYIQSSLPSADSYIASSGDPLSKRGAGHTDIYVKGAVAELITETFTAYNSTLYANAIRPTKQPVLSLVSVSSGAAFLQKDDFTALAGSVRAQDSIRFTTDFVTSVTISYYRDRTIEDAQTLFNDDTQAPANQQYPTTDLIAKETPLLVKAATPLYADYIAAITTTPGYIKANVINAVVSALTTYSNSLLLGQAVYLSDLNELVEQTEGVLRLAGTPTKFSPSEQAGVVDIITPEANKYVTLLNIGIS